MGKMRLKGKKKSFLFRGIFCIIIIYVTFAITFYYSLNNSKRVSNDKFIRFLLSGGNSSMITDYKLTEVVSFSTELLFDIDMKRPISILNRGITGNYSDSVNSGDYEEIKRVSSYMEDPNPRDIDNPIIYLYNSHQLEDYDSSNLDIYGITPNVLMASYLLKERLNSIGISTIVEDANLSEFMKMNKWDHASSYKASRIFILDKKNRYPSIKYFIDIHRDSVKRDSTTSNIGGKSYARVLFVVGLDHDNYMGNLNNAKSISNLCNKYYPGLSKGVLKKEGMNVDGIYNQDISPNVILIEIGGIDNNIDEVLNTVDALSRVLDYFIRGEKSE